MENLQYLVDETGKKAAVVIPIKGNEAALDEFIEDLYGQKKIRERKNEETISAKELLKGLADDGLA